MSTNAGSISTVQSGIDSRVLREGYGPGAWHGADLKGALADVSPALAFWRPGPGRHNIAEIALHHAFYARNVRAQLSGQPAEPFVLTGDDWFELEADGPLSWPSIQAVVESEQDRLTRVVAGIEGGKVVSPMADAERFDLILGITCHAIYHAGQVQLVKRMREK
jgi:DinB superfamily